MLSLFAAACATATSAPEPTLIPPTATMEPTATPVPPTATPEPTATSTPVPDPAISHLMFAPDETMQDAKTGGTIFEAGATAMYAAFDYVGIPASMSLEVELKRGESSLFDKTEDWTAGEAGTYIWPLLEDARLLIPGRYVITVRLAGKKLTGEFQISATRGQPGAQLVKENFADNELHWAEYNLTGSTSKVIGGQLRLSVDAPESLALSALNVDFEDFDLTVDARQATGGSGTFYSIVARSGASGSYFFNVFNNGTFSILTGTANEFKPLVAAKRSAALKPRNEVNRLRLIAHGPDFAFYINDVQVATIKDSQFKRGPIAFAAGTGSQGGMLTTFDNVEIKLPTGEIEIVATPTNLPPATLVPGATPKPVATKAPAAAPLADTIQRTRNAVEAIGGAMDRLYHGGGSESCVAFMESYRAVVNAPTYDVPASQQGAYAQYRQAVDFIAGSKVTQIANICLSGGGNIGSLDFNEARQAVNTAGSWLTQALAALGQ
ncbi:MAG: DUF1080 domain-containing protein [Chloroflexi bacterium]|nr:DUF1080 domain-containing protein [Chloroflexota bacterium]